MKKYVDWIFHFKYLVIFLVSAAIIALAYGGSTLRFSTDYRMFFSEQNSHLQAFEELQNTYTKNDNLIFILTPNNGDLFTRENLQAVQWLTKQSWLLPYTIRVDSVTNFQNIEAQADDLFVGDLIPDTFDFSSEELAKKKEIAITELLLVKRLISEKAHVAGVNLTIQFPDEDLEKALPELVAAGRALKQTFENKFPQFTVRLSGIVMQNAAFTESSMKDLKTLTPAMLLLVILGVGIFLRSTVATVSVVIAIIGSILGAMGIAGYLGITLSPATVVAPTIIMTLAVADCVHLLSTYYWRVEQGDNQYHAMHYSFRLNIMPIFLTTLTTMFGFLSLNFSDAPPFRDLGNIVAIGVWVAFLITLTLVPAFVVLFTPKPAKSKDKVQFLFPILADFVIQYKKPLIYTLGLVFITLLAFLPKNELNDEWVSYFSPKTDFRESADYLLNNLTGLSTIHYSVESLGAEGIHDPDYMLNLDKFAHWLTSQPEVVQISEITHTVKKLNKALHADDPSWYKVPKSREMIAQYLLLYELSLPMGLDLNNQINVDKSATRVHVVLDKMSTNQLLAFEQKTQNWMQENLPEYMRATGTSPDIMFAHIGFSNIRSMLFGLCVALALISVILCIAFKSIRLGLFSALPNLLPIGVSFGLWGIFVGEIGLSLSIVAGMTLGIVVDDTIHFLSKYRHARIENKNPEEAVRYAFDSVGKALFVTSFVLVAGFLVLTLSDFKLNSSMGTLTAVTIAVALFIDFFLIPPLLLILEGKNHALFGSGSHHHH
tara:strand:- start:26784 stop:29099 length:2316 start_codon:yes stop_codon:yes gene_type:complete